MPLYAPFNGGAVGNPIALQAGSASAPSITFGTAGTGIYASSSSMVSFAVGSAELFRVSSGSLVYCFADTLQIFPNVSRIVFGNSGDLRLTRTAAATLQLGAEDVNGAAVAQTVQVQSAITGTNQNGADWTFKGSKQTGSGTPGSIIFQTSVTLGSGTTQGTPVTGLTITGAAASQQPSVVIGNQALATNATEGFLYIPTCAGTPTGVPTTRTGRVALIYDTTTDQFWIYDGAWLQPKTPAAAAIITWQA